MIKAGVVGVGAMGQHHARVFYELSESSDVKLVGVADTDIEQAKKIADKYHAQAFKDYHDLIDQGLDVVSIVVPTSLHKKVASEFIKKGVNVLVEKPIADTLEDAEYLMNEAKNNGVKLMVGHIERFNPAVLKLKECIDNEELGDIISISAKRVGPMAIRIRDVGIIVDLGVHDIDVISFLIGKSVRTVKARAGNVKHPSDCEDYAILMLDFDDSKTGLVETNWLTAHKTRTLTVVGTKGVAYMDYIDQSLTICNESWEKDYDLVKKEPLKTEIEHFIDCAVNGVTPMVTAEDGIHVLKVALKALESADNNSTIKVV
ncbi:MAG: UDP-N-acetylglucosamine 3-dehydrogenase [Thermoplasmata archaeon]